MGGSGNTRLNDQNDQNRIPCPTAEDLSALFDNAVAPSKASELRLHLDECEECRETLQSFGILRNALRIGHTLPASRPIVLTSVEVDESPLPIGDQTSRTPILLYPILTAIAAVLVLALLTGQMLAGSDDPQGEPPASSNVLVIDGTPYSAGDDDTEFNAASADDMNREDDSASNVVTTDTEHEASTTWWLALASSIALLALGGFQWRRMNRRQVT